MRFRITASMVFQALPRPSPLAIVRERLFLNSESEDLWLSATCAVSFNGGRRSRNTKVPAQDSFRETVLQSELKFLVPSKRFPLPLFFSLQCFLNRSFGSVDSELL
jgi:hypothetical protein